MVAFERLIFEQFPKMPLAVRVVTYLLFVLLFIYLLLLPRFVDGQLVTSDASTGGTLPYRGVDLQLHVEGRVYKFRSNEDGYFSIPIIGRMPQSVQMQVLHMDRQLWFPVEVPVSSLWLNVLGSRTHRIEILEDKPFVKLTHLGERNHERNQASGGLGARVARALDAMMSAAHADSIQLPKTVLFAHADLGREEQGAIKEEVLGAYAKVARKPFESVDGTAPLSGSKSLSYIQRIQLVTNLESRFDLQIPDDHWQSMKTLDQLVDYLEKRKQIERALGSQSKQAGVAWPQIQQQFPVEARPTYGEKSK